MRQNRWLAVIMAAIGVIVAVTGLLFRFKGPYTYSFAVIGVLFAVVYTGYYFFKPKKD